MKKKIINLITVVGIVSTLTSASASGWKNNNAAFEGSYYTIAAKLEQLCPKCFNYCDCLPGLPEISIPETEAPEAEAPETPEAQAPGIQPETETPDTQQSYPVDSSYAHQVLSLVNEYRGRNGLDPLTLSDELSRVAQAKAQDMKNNNYFSHNSPTYGTPFEMMQSFGVTYRTAGENIAMGYSSPAAVVEGWMNSEGHRANILNSSFTQMGLGYVSSGNYWCQMFIG